MGQASQYAKSFISSSVVGIPLTNTTEGVTSPLNFTFTEIPLNATGTVNRSDLITGPISTAPPTLNETVEWTTAVTTTDFPEIIVFVDEKNPSAPPTLNASSSAKDLNEKFEKAEKIGAIAGGVMAVIVFGIVLAIYFLYRKYHGDSISF
ncbi:unnamed protein product [Hydatigera taeniaeformis]|uniref:Lectin_legB domain-containing protein n=1 Tax=Hydatigena taeniaeformis TaxID=6205 RepID=A0A0R3WJ29_HYDTA|nr:unnamed protein product [Hydatigera taeniaeformis]